MEQFPVPVVESTVPRLTQSNDSTADEEGNDDEFRQPEKQKPTSDKYEEPVGENPYSGLAPLFGRNIASVLITDILNCFFAP